MTPQEKWRQDTVVGMANDLGVGFYLTHWSHKQRHGKMQLHGIQRAKQFEDEQLQSYSPEELNELRSLIKEDRGIRDLNKVLGQTRAIIRYGDGFDLILAGFSSTSIMESTVKILEIESVDGYSFERMIIDDSDKLNLSTIAEQLTQIRHLETTRKVVFVSMVNLDKYNKEEWQVAFHRLNERRNIVSQDCPYVIILAGPEWFPWTMWDEAPDFFSVRSIIMEV